MTKSLATTGGSKSRPKQIGSRMKVALDVMAFEGLEMNEAAQRAGLSTSALRKSLGKPHILNYLSDQRKVVRAGQEPRTYLRMVSLLHQDDNKAAAVAAGRVLMNAPDEGPTYGARQQTVAGIVIQIVNTPAPEAPLGPMITVMPVNGNE